MTPFDETVPISDPLELAHRQLKDATDRENRLNVEIKRLTEMLDQAMEEMGNYRHRERQILDVIQRHQRQDAYARLHRREGSDCTMARGDFIEFDKIEAAINSLK